MVEFLRGLRTLQLFWSPAGEISSDGCWVLFHEYTYMYTGDSRIQVVWEWLTHFRDDHYLVGH